MKYHFSIAVFVIGFLNTWFPSLCYGQLKDTTQTFGLNGYYLWEESDGDANILRNSMIQFTDNYEILLKQDSLMHTWTPSKLKHQLMHLSHNVQLDPGLNHQTQQIKHGFLVYEKTRSTSAANLVYIKKNQRWQGTKMRLVLYFLEQEDGSLQFLYDSDSLTWLHSQKKQKAYGSIQVIYKDKKDQAREQRVFAFHGQELFEDEMQNKGTSQLLLFNGYRGPKKEDDPTDNLLTTFDRYSYWFKFDDYLKKHMHFDVALYLDGSCSLTTSQMHSKWHFLWHYLRWKSTRRPKKASRIYKKYSQRLNQEGFDQRVNEGIIAGKVYLANFNPLGPKVLKDTVYLFSHSMGYAYSLGFLKTVDTQVVYTNYYALSPESGLCGAPNWNLFQEVYQYGSKFTADGVPHLNLTDGIAPQLPIKGLEFLDPTKSGRIFTPEDWPVKGFIDSHMVYGLYWIFETLKPNDLGYLKRM